MINVILLSDIKKLAPKGTIVPVADGYAFNFLFPQKLARSATKKDFSTAKTLEDVRNNEREARKELVRSIKKLVKEEDGALLVLQGKAKGENLFASLHETDVANAFKEKFNIELNPKKEVKLKDPLKTVGNHTVTVVIEGENIDFRIAIEAI